MGTSKKLSSLLIVILALTIYSESPARITVNGSHDDKKMLQEMLKCGAFPVMPAPGSVQIDSATGQVTLTGGAPSSEFGKLLKRIIDDTTQITVTIEKQIDSIGVFIGAYNGGTRTNDKGNGRQSVDICDLKKLTKTGTMGVGAQPVYIMHELYEQYVASKYCLRFTQAHDSALNVEAKIIGSLNGGMEFRRIGDLRRGGCLFFIYQKVGTTQRIGLKFVLSQFLQVDSAGNGIIDNFRERHISNGCSGGLCEFDKSDQGTTFETIPNTKNLSGADYMILDDKGNTYFSLPLENKVVRQNYEGNIDIQYQNANLVSPSGLAFDPVSEELFIGDNSLDQVVVFDVNGNYLRSLKVQGLSLTAGLDIDTDGNLYVSSHGSDSIFHITPAGKVINIFGHPSLQGPAGLTIADGPEKLFVVSNTNNKVLAFEPDGTFIEEFADNQELSSPWGIAIEGGKFDRRFQVGDSYSSFKKVVVTSAGNNSLVSYNPDGSVLDNFTEPNYSPSAVILENAFDFTPVSIENISTEIPEKFSLHQNYPNPFNPSTKIKFDLRNSSNVKLVIYDMTGKEVAVLVNSNLNAGAYQYTFDAAGLTSGVYFYRLVTNNFSETKKMLLIK